MPLPFTNAHRQQRFWRWFQANSARLFAFESDQEVTFHDLTVELHRVNSNLTFEFGPVENGRREFIVSAGGIQAAFPAVRSLVASAPALPAWTVIPFRPPKSLDLRLAIGGLELGVDDLARRAELPLCTLDSSLSYRGSSGSPQECPSIGFTEKAP